MNIKNRVKELRMVKASDLVPNPRNWRTHPRKQQDALKGILAEIGYADALLARICPDGSLMLVDGHLRAETTPDAMVPVLILDLSEAEADKVLLTLDPLAAMAEASKDALGQLLLENQSQNSALQAMLDDLAASNGIDVFADGHQEPTGSGEGEGESMQDEYGVYVACTTAYERAGLLAKLRKEGFKAKEAE